MTTEITLEDIQTILTMAGVEKFAGTYTALGGGDMNETFLLDFADRQVILRIARYPEQNTLQYEASALRIMSSPRVPELLFFDPEKKFNGRMWILEGRVPGGTAARLTTEQFASLGDLLAHIHQIKSDEKGIQLWSELLMSCQSFGSEEVLLAHPDPTLRKLLQDAQRDFQKIQPFYNLITPVLAHSDITPSNLLVAENVVGLIDWEFAKFADPMADFSTIYYEDMEYNQGKWRIKIQPAEKAALFEGYTRAGGIINEERIRFWIWFDKLCAAVFLYWQINQSGRQMSQEQSDQFKRDYTNLINSLTNTPLLAPVAQHAAPPSPPQAR
jgi:aminoglycoside phosphotransferase (APT) family kinase protein